MFPGKTLSLRLPSLGKFQTDVLWNIGGFVVQGICGILLNVVIGRGYRAEGLGLFNLVLSLLIVFSQLGAFGIQYSVLKFLAEFQRDRRLCKEIFLSALVSTVIVAAAATGVAYATSGLCARLFSMPHLVGAWQLALPGLFFFCINKVLLGTLNGLSLMRRFAVANAMRFPLWMAALAVVAGLGVPYEQLPIIVTLGEGMLLVLVSFSLVGVFGGVRARPTREWTRRHFHFGLHGFLSGTLTELNTRIDVLLLGIFSTERNVGIYSMAALLVEGFLQLTVAIRNNYNPLITEHAVRSEVTQLEQRIAVGRRYTYLLMAAAGLVMIIGYPLFAGLVLQRAEFADSWLPMAIMTLLLAACAGYLPFNMIFIQFGRPAQQTLYQVAILVTTFALNLLLVPWFGVPGAAWGTGTSLVLSAVYLRYFARRWLDVRL